MRTKRLLAAVGLVALLTTPVMSAAPARSGTGCAPDGGWSLWAVSDVLAFLGLTEAPPSMDGNEDGWTCVRFQTLANGRKGWTAVIYADNNVR